MEGSCDKERFKTFVLTQLVNNFYLYHYLELLKLQYSFVLNKIPQTNPYPAKHSVLVMNNARIHHDDDLVAAVEDIGRKILYLPPYSPNLNPIKTAFSALKSWLKRYRDFTNYFDPIYEKV
ncbi:hypothetical protein RclHR1_05910011 [Rhizophagus clarus]|uniref:Tc1-like transposase DDE domain-containing protein n=1 Tax=Rhizophagus clarus TaxID=94130 RepID=A0A2Z6RPB1_9GLOM|nr:hypothetical protein RclHR1_05910011 [Rhizophagus clarus]